MSDAIRAVFETNPPPIARTLGWRMISCDPEARSVEIGFDARPEFANPAGNVQGGILVAMMDDAMGPAVVAASNATRMPSSIDIHAHFLRPIKPGPVTVKAHVTQLGARIAYIEAQLFDAQNRLCARASSSAMLVDMPGA